MNKSIKFIITLLLSSFSLVFANSGPTYWQGYPSSDIMTIDKNSPIEVKSENLTFDFSENTNDSYSVTGKVTAEYELANPPNETRFVQMVFPFVERLSNVNYDDINITADGKELSYEVYLGNSVDKSIESSDGNFEFENIVNTISNDIYEAKRFTADEIGKLYYIEIKPTTDEGLDFTVDFNYDQEKTNILIKNFNSFSRDDELVRIASGCYEPQTAEIYVLGEDIDFNVKGYTFGSSKMETTLFTYKITEKNVDVKTYLLDQINYTSNDYVANYEYISDIQLYNLYAKELDKYFINNLGFCSDYDIFAASYNERIITLVYTVEFPPASNQKVSVTYKTDGTMDKRNTSKPQYLFDYILNPAENWNSFSNLNIKIITPEEAPYVIDSSINLKKEEANIYTATLENLPDEDLSFSLYANEKVSLLDNIEGLINRNFGYFAPIVIGLMGILILIVVVLSVNRIYRKKSKLL